MAFSKITISKSQQTSDLVVKFVADTNISVEQYWEPRPVIMGVARKDTGAIAELSVYGNAWGPAVTAKKIGFLIPYAKVAVGIMDPSLPDEECDDILNQLGLSVDNLDATKTVCGRSCSHGRVSGLRVSRICWLFHESLYSLLGTPQTDGNPVHFMIRLRFSPIQRSIST